MKQSASLSSKQFWRSRRTEMLQAYSLLIPVVILVFIFHYLPMYGLVIAFQKYVPGDPFIGQGARWVGLQNFQKFVGGIYFLRCLKNTLVLSLYELVFGFTAPIAFALLMDQIRNARFKKAIQTASYLPHFISTVIVAGMVVSFIDSNGIITRFLHLFGLPLKNWRVVSSAFAPTYTLTKIWKGFGFSSILYFSTMSAIDPGLYESARMDGANRWQQVWHITLPGIANLVFIKLILNVGGILGSDTNLILLLYDPATYDVADVFGTYIYRVGLLGGQYSYTTAAGLFMSIIGFIVTFITNKLCTVYTGFGLW